MDEGRAGGCGGGVVVVMRRLPWVSMDLSTTMADFVDYSEAFDEATSTVRTTGLLHTWGQNTHTEKKTGRAVIIPLCL